MMPDEHDDAEASAPRAEVGRFRRLKAARERGLVVAGVVLGSVLFAAGLRRGARAWVQAVCGGAVIVVLAAAWMAASRM